MSQLNMCTLMYKYGKHIISQCIMTSKISIKTPATQECNTEIWFKCFYYLRFAKYEVFIEKKGCIEERHIIHCNYMHTCFTFGMIVQW